MELRVHLCTFLDIHSGAEPDYFRLVGIQLQSSRRAPVLDRGNTLFHFQRFIFRHLAWIASRRMWFCNCVSLAYRWWFTIKSSIVSTMSSVYSTNFCGPMTEPCGTLNVRFTGSNILNSTQNDWVRLDRYYLNQLSARSWTPNQFWSTSSSIPWSIVPNAALRSNSTSRETSPASITLTISLRTMVMAVSVDWVEWCCRYADWHTGIRWYRLACSWNRFTTNRSVSCEMKLRFYIDRNNLMSSGSSEGCLIWGLTTACLCDSGKIPSSNDSSIMFVIAGASTLQHFFTTHVGIGSSTHCLFGALWIALVTSARVILVKLSRGGTNRDRMIGEGVFTVVARIASTFQLE